MTNKEIAGKFQLLGKLMELHGENPFKYRSYGNAYTIMRKIEAPLEEMSIEELAAIPGLGQAISTKTRELIETGQMNALQQYVDMTPPGVIDMLGVRGFGPKKVAAIWQELEIDTIGELVQACEENRLVSLKGFGLKTQEDLKNKLRYFNASKGYFHYASAEDAISSLSEFITEQFPNQAKIIGDAAQEEQVIQGIEVMVIDTEERDFIDAVCAEFPEQEGDELLWDQIPLHIETTGEHCFSWDAFQRSSPTNFLAQFPDGFMAEGIISAENICEEAGVEFIPAPQRFFFGYSQKYKTQDIIQTSDIKGIIHSHSTYSDGLHSLKEMGAYALDQGFEYLLITDHSQSAFYANGLKEDRVYQQFEEIDKLNAEYEKKGHLFKIYKGIESDILNDGNLDYPESVLQDFDCIIASVHSNLRMDIDKATERLIKAIENPYTRILGHPTGRLLLSREGYPIDHQKIIDACAANEVVIELNAHPNRLDIDYRYIGECLDQGVLLSINPDAHTRESMHLIRHGVRAARKAWLPSHLNLSSYSRVDFEDWLDAR